MNEQRIAEYVQLIQQLLACPNGQESEILANKSNPNGQELEILANNSNKERLIAKL